MLKLRMIARLDIKAENLIKGIHLEGLRVLGRPWDFANNYYQQGIDELLYMDAVASLYGRNSLTDIIKKTAQNIFIPLTVGGGIRSLEDASGALRCGADKIALNTAAIKNPALITKIADKFGSQCTVLSIEAKRQANGNWEAYIDNGRERTKRDVIAWVQEAQDRGAGEILLTSIDQEGTGQGFDLELIKRVQVVARIPLVVSGGAGSVEHIEQVVSEVPVQGVAVAKILHYKKTDISSIKAHLHQKGHPIRVL